MSVDLARDVIDYCLEQPLSYWKSESDIIVGNFHLSLKDIAYPSFNTVIDVDIKCLQNPRREIWVHITLDKKLISTLQLDSMYYPYYKAQLLQKFVEVAERYNYSIGAKYYFNNLQDSERVEVVELLYTLKDYNKWIETNNQKTYYVILDNGLSISITKDKDVSMKLFYFLPSNGCWRKYIMIINSAHLSHYFGNNSDLMDNIWNNIPKYAQQMDSEKNESEDDEGDDFISLLKSSIKELS